VVGLKEAYNREARTSWRTKCFWWCEHTFGSSPERRSSYRVPYRLSVMCRTWLSKCAVTYGTPSRARLTANKRVEPVVSISWASC